MSQNDDSLGRLLRIDDATALAGHSDGMQAAYAFSAEEWRAEALRVATELATAGAPFTIDDLRRNGVEDPDKQQRWGSLIAALKATNVVQFHSLALHRQPSGDQVGIRVWVGTPEQVGDSE